MSIVDRTYGQTLKRIACICLTMVLWSAVSGQVNVNVPAQAGASYTLQDLSLLSYTNTVAQRYTGCYADISVDNISTGQNFAIRSGSFTISAGVNMPGYAVIIGNTLIRPSDDYYALEQKGKFPPGRYNLCVTLYTSHGVVLGNSCTSLNIDADAAVVLISPTDEEVLHTFSPTLVWQPINLISDNTYTYTIHIAELGEGQSYGDAIGINPPLVYEKGLTSAAYNYPSSAPELEEDKKYVWQVEASLTGSQKINYSEIWMFQYKKTKTTPPDKKPKSSTQQYPHLTKTLSSAVYQYSDKIYFMYDNYANDSILDYSIIKAGSAKPITQEGKNVVVLKSFNNYLSMPVPEQLKKESKKARFILEVRNSRKEKWALRFSIKSKKTN